MSIQYFMDEMMFYEIEDIIENIPYIDRISWEQCRLNTYLTAQIDHSKVKMDDFLPLPWEKDERNSRQNITNEEIENLKKLEKLWSKGTNG